MRSSMKDDYGEKEEKKCCEQCDKSWGGGITMIPRVNACGNVDCLCHQERKCNCGHDEKLAEYKRREEGLENNGAVNTSGSFWTGEHEKGCSILAQEKKENRCVAFCHECDNRYTEWISNSKVCPECEGEVCFTAQDVSDWEEDTEYLLNQYEDSHYECVNKLDGSPRKTVNCAGCVHSAESRQKAKDKLKSFFRSLIAKEVNGGLTRSEWVRVKTEHQEELAKEREEATEERAVRVLTQVMQARHNAFQEAVEVIEGKKWETCPPEFRDEREAVNSTLQDAQDAIKNIMSKK